MTKTSDLAVLINAALLRESAPLYQHQTPTNSRPYMCKVASCPNRAVARGYCNAHYLRVRNGRPLDMPLQHKNGGVCRKCDSPVDGKGGWSLCKQHYRAARRRIIRGTCIEAMGGACADCGGVFPQAVYDFHHLDMREKEFSPSNMIDNNSVAKIAAEVTKCVLLCANCHRMRHFGD